MSIFLDPKRIGIGPGNCEHETISVNGTHSSQGVKFYDDARNFSYNSQVTIYRGEAPIIWLKGMVVRNLIVSIVEESSDIHLKALRDLVEEETGIRAEQKRTKSGHVQPVR